jgi:hypothetical protein
MLRKKSEEYDKDEFFPQFIRERYTSEDNVKEIND